MALEGLAAAIGKAMRKLFGSRNERLVRAYRQRAAEVAEFEKQFEAFSEEDFPAKTAELRSRLADGEPLEKILPEAFAVVRVASERTIGLRPFDVQLVGGQVLVEGRLAEMVTGEGKTLVATLPIYLRALVGKVHLVTTNDYLVRVGCEWMRPVYELLGLTVGSIQSSMDPPQRIPEYACDITYGTNNEFGFDYLRDNMKTSREEQVQGPLDYVIVDEVDSVLIDEARTPLIISGPAFDSTEKYAVADRVARQLRPETDFEIKEKEHQVPLTERGVKRAEELVGVGSFYIAGNMQWPHLMEQSLRAHHIYRRDKDYVVRGDEVIIVDEFTGRLMPGRQWSDGLHQAVEAKEGITIKEETQTLATITFQNFFKLYDCLAGMTGTAMTEAEEFDKIYHLEVVEIPTNRPLNRVSHPDVVFMTLKEKQKAIVDEVHEYSRRGRPVLVGTIAIEASEQLSAALMRSHGVEHEVLSARHHAREADIVAQAGQRHTDRAGHVCGNVTIATNMAGRGTDIKLGDGVVNPDCNGPWDVDKQDRPSDFGNKCCINCPEYDGTCAHCFKPKRDPSFPKRGRTECRSDPPCGLHIVGTERHESRRIDNQLRGRAGRQGDPGSSRFFLSLQDDLMRVFASDWVQGVLRKLGMEEGMSLEHGFLSRGIENAQKKVEERNFSIRKNLLEYDEVMDSQRKVFYGRRQTILDADSLRPIVWEMLVEGLDNTLDDVLRPEYPYERVAEWARRTLETNVRVKALSGRSPEELEIYLKDRAAEDARTRVSETLGEFVTMPDAAEAMPGAEVDEAEMQVNYAAVAAWARDRLDARLNERELRKMDFAQIEETLQEAAAGKAQATDCSALAELLDEDYPYRRLADWLLQKYELEVPLSELRQKQPEQIRPWLLEQLSAAYDRKERDYPIEHAVEQALRQRQEGAAFDVEGLAEWASWFYCVDVPADRLGRETVGQVRDELQQVAAEAEASGALAERVGEGLRRWLSRDDATLAEHEIGEALNWAAETLGVEMTAEEVTGMPRRELEPELLKRARAVRRGSMNTLERYLLLQVLDTSWKEHLREMDHLKSGIGMRAYAQVDPKIEYKREGFRLFEEMLGGVNEKFADLFFKARWAQREALKDIWSGQSASHEELAPSIAKFEQQREAALENLKTQAEEKPKPIVRTAARVGRNDPCPCGSGKKFKKCCGRNA